MSLDELVDVLWEDNPPPSAVNVIHRYVGALRRVFEPELAARETGTWLVRNAATYHLAVSAESADLLQLRELVEQARNEDPTDSVATYVSALRLWRGPCAQGIIASARARAIFTEIDHECLGAVCEAADVALSCGMAGDVAPFVRQASALDPLNEAVQARMVRTLAASGNQAAALKVYEGVRRKLADELGIDPGPELAAAFQQVLAPPPEPEPVVGQTIEPVVRPAQLPPDLPAFAGRRTELKYLQSLLPSNDEPSRGLTTIALDGMPGAGKTTLAVHWAHSVADRFPDGQLYVNLRGFDPNGVQLNPAEALRGFLDALGMPPDRIPDSVDAQTALYRSVLSNRRVLVLVDNARDVAQVRPLLPGAAGCHVIVTSRNRLTGLVAAEGAYLLTLDTLSIEDARETLVRRLGPERTEAEAAAVEEIIALCGRLPLALAIVAARAAANPHFPLTAITTKLKRAGLGAFRESDALDVRTVFSWSYRILSADAARLFRLLSLHSGPDASLGAAASLLGADPCDTQDLLDELTRTRFLMEPTPGRFASHDLIRAYAIELRDQYETEVDQQEALGRLLDYYLHTSYAAALLIGPHQPPEPPPPARPGVTPDVIADRADAMAWFNDERVVLGNVVKNASTQAPVLQPYSWSIAMTMMQFYQRAGLLHDWASTMTAGLDAAERANDAAGQAVMHRTLAGALHYLGRNDDALVHLERTEELFNQLGYTADHAYVNSNFGTVLIDRGEYERAIDRHERALQLYAEVGDVKGQGISLQSIGHCLTMLGQLDEALAKIRDAMSRYQSIGDRGGEADCWTTLGEIHHRLGTDEQAVKCYRLAVETFRELGDQHGTVVNLILLGDALRDVGSTDEAASTWRSALTIIEELRLPAGESVRARLASSGRLEEGIVVGKNPGLDP